MLEDGPAALDLNGTLHYNGPPMSLDPSVNNDMSHTYTHACDGLCCNHESVLVVICFSCFM